MKHVLFIIIIISYTLVVEDSNMADGGRLAFVRLPSQ